MPYKFVRGRTTNVIKSPREKIPANRPVWMAPRISRLRAVSVLRKPVLERVKTMIKVTEMIRCGSSRNKEKEHSSNECVDSDLHGQPGDDEGG